MDDRKSAPVSLTAVQELIECVQATKASLPIEGKGREQDEDIFTLTLTMDELLVLRLALQDYIQRHASRVN